MKFLDKSTIKSAFQPVADLSAAAITGARIGVAKGDRVAVVLDIGDSLTGGLLSIALKQHNAASAGTTKALSVDLPYFVKAAAATKFTKVEQVSAQDTYVLSSTFDTEPGQVVFEIEAQDLDVDNGFAYFSVNVADSGTVARTIAGIYVLQDLRNAPGYEIDV